MPIAIILSLSKDDVDDRPLQRQHVEQFKDGGDFVALGIDRLLTQHKARFAGIGRNEMQRLGRRIAGLAAAQCLAIDGDNAANHRVEGRHPACKGRFQRLGIDKPEKAPQRLLAGDAIPVRQEAPQPAGQFLADALHIIEVVGPAQNGDKRCKHNLIKRIVDHSDNPVIANRANATQKIIRHRRAPKKPYRFQFG